MVHHQKKATKSAPVLTTPLTVSSRSTTESKRAVTLMSGLNLKSPLQKKNKACNREEASLVDSVDYEDPALIAWQTKGGVASAIRHHFPDNDKRLKLPYEDQIIQLLTKFKPADLRPVLQGLSTDAGKNWRQLKLSKLKTMRQVAPEFAKICVELCNATTEVNALPSIPVNVTL